MLNETERISYDNFVNPVSEFLARCHQDMDVLADLEGSGPVGEFEREFAKWLGVGFAVGVSSGTVGLMTALWAAEIRPGDRVLVSPYGWPQTVSAICSVGAVPVFADIDPISLNLSPDSAAEYVGECQAILVTHTFGLPADMIALREIAEAAGIPLIADAAQALGAKINGESVAQWADMSVYSFGRHKALTTGEGGMIVTNNRSLFEHCVMVSQHGSRVFRQADDVQQRRLLGDFGLSFRMHPLAAILGLSQIEKIDPRIAERRQVCLEISARLAKYSGLRVPNDIGGFEHTFHHYVASIENGTREEIIRVFQEHGIPSDFGPVRIPFHKRLALFAGNPPLPFLDVSPYFSGDGSFSFPYAEQQCAEREILLTAAIRQAEQNPGFVDKMEMSLVEGLHCGSVRGCGADRNRPIGQCSLEAF